MNDRQTTVKPSPRLCKAWARPIKIMFNALVVCNIITNNILSTYYLEPRN